MQFHLDTATQFEQIRPRYPEFKDRVSLVTGSSRGIGKGIALRLAREGMIVFLHGSNDEELATTVAEFQALNIKVYGISTDFASENGVDDLFNFVREHTAKLDLVVNNAASLRRVRFITEHRNLLDYQLAVNIRAPYLCSWKAAEMMRTGSGGSIINISSVGGIQAHHTGLPYDAAKGAMDAMTRAMALELAPDNIRVNAIAPGAIERPLVQTPEVMEKIRAVEQRIPLNRFGTPLDIGATVAFLASEDASYITGQIIYVDGGITAQLSPPGQPI